MRLLVERLWRMIGIKSTVIYYVMIVEILVQSDHSTKCYFEYANLKHQTDQCVTVNRLQQQIGGNVYSFNETDDEVLDIDCVNAYLTPDDDIFGFTRIGDGTYIRNDGDPDYAPSDSESESDSDSDAESVDEIIID